MNSAPTLLLPRPTSCTEQIRSLRLNRKEVGLHASEISSMLASAYTLNKDTPMRHAADRALAVHLCHVRLDSYENASSLKYWCELRCPKNALILLSRCPRNSFPLIYTYLQGTHKHCEAFFSLQVSPASRAGAWGKELVRRGTRKSCQPRRVALSRIATCSAEGGSDAPAGGEKFEVFTSLDAHTLNSFTGRFACSHVWESLRIFVALNASCHFL